MVKPEARLQLHMKGRPRNRLLRIHIAALQTPNIKHTKYRIAIFSGELRRYLVEGILLEARESMKESF